MKPPSAFELIIQFLFVLYEIIWTVIRNNWKPFYTISVKISIIALIIWGVASLIPHGILLLKEITYLGWVCTIIIYRLLTMKYDDFEDEQPEEENETLQIPLDDDGPPAEPESVSQPVQNVFPKIEREKLNDNNSTRE